MDISFFLARVMGVTMAILYAGALIHFKRLKTSIRSIEDQPILLFISGFITLLLGLLVVEVHNLWVWNWPVLITIFGWIMIVVGIVRLLIPEAALNFGRWLMERNPVVIQLVLLVLCGVGVYLAIMGFWQL